MADTAEGGNDPQVTFKVKTSGEGNHSITMPESATVLDLKTRLSGEAYENVPVERQRLIYSGRVMKNDDPLSTYKIKAGNTIHMVKSAASNPAAPAASSASAPAPQAIPSNMNAGIPANNLLAGLTGARFAGHANLPSRDIFGADGGMGAPPSEEQMADLLSNPAMAQTMNEALNNPAFVDYMIQQNPMLRNVPNAREMITSPYFRNLMTNPEAIRAAARMRSMFGGGQGPNPFPAPGATDTTPADAPAAGGEGEGEGEGGNGAGAVQQNPFAAMFGAPGAPGAGAGGMGMGMGMGGANPFMALFNPPAAAGGAAQTTGSGVSPQAGAGPNPAANPFAGLFGGAGMPQPNPEMMRQMMEMFGGGGGAGGFGGAPAAPPDNRPPEERYAEQLRQLNDMGFFDFDRNVAALRRSGGSVQGAIEHLLNG